MKKFIFLLLMSLTLAMSANAESYVYVFVKSLANSDTNIAIDGTTVCDLNGPIKRIQKPIANSNMKMDMVFLESCYRKITIDSERKIIVTATMNYKNCTNGNITTYKAEYPLEVEDGETYYLQLTSKGLNDMKIKEPKEKDVKKWMKKWVELTPVTYDN